MQPAYTSVAARQTLSRPQPASAPSSQTSAWTPEVRAYVQRAFGESLLGVEPDAMQEKLKAVITQAAESGNISSIDWSTYPLPQQLIIQERAAKLPTAFSSLSHNATFSANNTLGKRKSLETEPTDIDAAQPPGKKQAKATNLEDRITGKKERKAAKKEQFRNGLEAKADVLERRKARFGVVPQVSTSYRSKAPSPEPTGPVVGLCQKLEKQYLRLTAAPKPEEVRPVPVLKEMMALLRRKWMDEHNYTYACDQFKSLRQDLTVQHVKSEFTVKVYESHARIALEMGDLGEYNQCQTQLRALYKLGHGGKPEEFTAYRILYFIYTCNRADMNNALADLTETDKQMEGVQHALKVRAAVAAGNYHRFFKLYQETPYMGAYLLDKCIPRQRLAALAAICKTYKPDVPLSFLINELAFQGDNDDPDHGARACVQFVCDHGGESLIIKKDDGEIRFLSGKAGRLFEDARSAAFKRVDIKGQI